MPLTPAEERVLDPKTIVHVEDQVLRTREKDQEDREKRYRKAALDVLHTPPPEGSNASADSPQPTDSPEQAQARREQAEARRYAGADTSHRAAMDKAKIAEADAWAAQDAKEEMSRTVILHDGTKHVFAYGSDTPPAAIEEVEGTLYAPANFKGLRPVRINDIDPAQRAEYQRVTGVGRAPGRPGAITLTESDGHQYAHWLDSEGKRHTEEIPGGTKAAVESAAREAQLRAEALLQTAQAHRLATTGTALDWSVIDKNLADRGFTEAQIAQIKLQMQELATKGLTGFYTAIATVNELEQAGLPTEIADQWRNNLVYERSGQAAIDKERQAALEKEAARQDVATGRAQTAANTLVNQDYQASEAARLAASERASTFQTGFNNIYDRAARPAANPDLAGPAFLEGMRELRQMVNAIQSGTVQTPEGQNARGFLNTMVTQTPATPTPVPVYGPVPVGGISHWSATAAPAAPAPTSDTMSSDPAVLATAAADDQTTFNPPELDQVTNAPPEEQLETALQIWGRKQGGQSEGGQSEPEWGVG